MWSCTLCHWFGFRAHRLSIVSPTLRETASDEMSTSTAGELLLAPIQKRCEAVTALPTRSVSGGLGLEAGEDSPSLTLRVTKVGPTRKSRLTNSDGQLSRDRCG